MPLVVIFALSAGRGAEESSVRAARRRGCRALGPGSALPRRPASRSSVRETRRARGALGLRHGAR